MSRWSYFFRRILLTVPVLIFGTSIIFVIIRLGPIDPVAAILGPTGNPTARHDIAVQLGLIYPSGEPVPIWQQYVEFMSDMLTGNLGQSWVLYPDRSVYDIIASRAPQTIWLGFWSVLIALFIGIPLGFYAGLNPNTWSDYVASFGGIVWRAMPNFWLAVILSQILLASANPGGLFGTGFDYTTFLVRTDIVTSPNLVNLSDPSNLLQAIKQIMPAALVLGSSSMGNEMRIGRTAVLETVNSNYVETARAKGVGPRSIVWKHIFRNALIPLVPIITSEAFILIGGSVLVETIFAINGIGLLFFRAITNGDLPLVGSLGFIFILLTLSINILQDFLYTVIDPRVGYDSQ